MIARKFLVRGNVQGVGFCYFAQRSAARHQVFGYVRNCEDGTVEAFAQGTLNQVEQFRDDLSAGPRYSRVAEVEEIVTDPSPAFKSFRIER